MKKIISIFATVLCLLNNTSYGEETAAESTTSPTEHPAKVPNFSPPKDLSGPIFPPEDLIGQPNPETNKFLTEFVNMMATLGLIISLILIVAWFLKRMLNARQDVANTTSLIKVVERRALSPKTVIYLLDIEGKSIIISESQNGVTRLADYTAMAEEETKQLPSAFNKLLGPHQTDSSH
jgi:flagellar biogenesis protein FliO